MEVLNLICPLPGAPFTGLTVLAADFRRYITKEIIMHNHIWRDCIMPTPKESKKELLISIKNSGKKGFWLKGKEIDFGKELELEGFVKLCCGGKAATAI